MKIMKLEALAEKIESLKSQGKKVVLCHGCFDLVHIGHIKHFEAAKAKGDYLVVTVTPDEFVNKGPGRPYFSEFLRSEFLANLDCIDFVAVNRWPTAVETIKLLKPSIYIKGSEYKETKKDITGNIKKEIDAAKEVDAVIDYTDEITFSSSTLLNSHFDSRSNLEDNFINFMKNSVGKSKLLDTVESMAKLNVVVIGDTILDEYTKVEPIGMPSKAANVSVKELDTEVHLGGTLAIANHISAFVNHVDLVTLLGNDCPFEGKVQSEMKENVAAHIVNRENSPTVKKKRYLVQSTGAKLLEVASINDTKIEEEVENRIIEKILPIIEKADMVLLADFGHGLVTPRIIELLENKAKFLAVNVQCNSLNYGFNTINKIKKADFVSIDERELRLAFNDKYSEIRKLVDKIFDDFDYKAFSVTQGHRGALITNGKADPVMIPAFARHVVDAVGAGDAYLSLASLGLLTSNDSHISGFLGSLSASIATSYLGNQTTVSKTSYLKYLVRVLK
jgi:rfaE bifunctional protein nucleotidyltransferase chain/domain